MDFYCPFLQLVVEVDGPHHETQELQDDRRTMLLSRCGVRVVRVRARAVMDDVDGVVEWLRTVIVGIVGGLH